MTRDTKFIARALAFALALAAAPPLSAPAAAAPALVIEPPTVDLGILEGDVAVPFGFTLRNDGDEPLLIREVNPTCGCTVVFLADSLLAPGEIVPLTGAFHSRKLEGSVLKTILIETNDPARPRAVAILRVWVQRELTLSYESVDFGSFDAETIKEEKILIRPSAEIALEILGVEAPPERYQCWIEDGEKPGDRVLHVTLLPQREGIVLADTIRVRTNVKNRETIALPVRGHARGKRSK